VLAYETRSRVAWHVGKLDEYKLFAERCVEACGDMNGQALRARTERLLRAANAGAVAPGEARAEPSATTLLETAWHSAFDACDEPEQRAQRTLQLLLSHSGVETGALYLVRELGPKLAAWNGAKPAAELTASVSELIDAELRQRGLATASIDGELSTDLRSHALVLLCHLTSTGTAVTGVAAFALSEASRFIHPGALAARLSRMLADAGDVIPLAVDA